MRGKRIRDAVARGGRKRERISEGAEGTEGADAEPHSRRRLFRAPDCEAGLARVRGLGAAPG